MPRAITASIGARGRTRVKGALDGTRFASSLGPWGGGEFWLHARIETLAAAGVKSGDEVHVTFDVDKAPRPVVVPPELKRALAKAKPARASFDKFAPSHRRAYAECVAARRRP